MSRGRPPLGIQVLCALAVLDGGLSLLQGLVGLGGSILFGSPLGGIVGLIAIGLAVGELLVAWGLWGLQSWAWTAAVLVVAGSLVLDVAGLLLGGAGFVPLVLSGGVLLYLLSQRDRFKRSRAY